MRRLAFAHRRWRLSSSAHLVVAREIGCSFRIELLHFGLEQLAPLVLFHLFLEDLLAPLALPNLGHAFFRHLS